MKPSNARDVPAKLLGRMLSKIIALCLLCAFVGRLVFRTKVKGMGKTGRSVVDVALVVMAIVYVVQVVPALVR